MEGTDWLSASQVVGGIDKEKAQEIDLFCRVAQANSATISLREIIQVTSIDLSEEGLARAWRATPALSTKYEIKEGGVVHEHGFGHRLEEREESRQRASSNIRYAQKFSTLVGGKAGVRVLSISGSTSYYSVTREDDLDIFCITRSGHVWPILVKSLLLARILKSSDFTAPQICLSYVMDEDYAIQEFSKPQDGLFARDAISTLVIRGDQYYTDLLAKSGWMGGYFPKMYLARITRRGPPCEAQKNRPSGSPVHPLARILNLFLYATAGTYIRMKSHLLNRKFAKLGQRSRAFRVRMGHNRCIYESLSYLELRKMYSTLGQTKYMPAQANREIA